MDPVSHVLKVFNVVTDNLAKLIDRFREALVEKFGLSISPKKLDAFMHRLKVKLQGHQNALFNKLDTFLLQDLFALGDNVVLAADAPHTTYSAKMDSALVKSISKHENNLALLNLAKGKMEQEFLDLKVLQEDLDEANARIKDLLHNCMGVQSVEELERTVKAERELCKYVQCARDSAMPP
ncbi:unnamed protein product [Schistocephalus solidus]|uniref:Protein MIS12 homolog n=1 Tax=Schistocephalus solidus TaxID=70667 RepID=A0A183TMN3_SCHSO|nr:unnamed protein product [Schistocephalus solidus]